jgi:hypothetical protein
MSTDQRRLLQSVSLVGLRTKSLALIADSVCHFLFSPLSTDSPDALQFHYLNVSAILHILTCETPGAHLNAQDLVA